MSTADELFDPAAREHLARRKAEREAERDLAHEADMRALQREQLRGDVCDNDEQRERNATGIYDYDEPTQEELDELYADQVYYDEQFDLRRERQRSW